MFGFGIVGCGSGMLSFLKWGVRFNIIMVTLLLLIAI